MDYSLYLYIALAIFIAGMVFRSLSWFTRKTDSESADISFGKRILSAVKGMTAVFLSARVFTLIKVFILDVVLQRRILKENALRWVMHICIYGGFIMLLLMHALGSIITENIFYNYYSTLNPFMFLRDFFGALVIIGLLIAVFRRFILRMPRLSTNAMDIYLIVIVGVIIFSGIILEGVKITSHGRFMEMIEEYSGIDDEDELKALEAYWVEEYFLVSSSKINGGPDVLKKGKEVHEYNCASCHSRPGWAFTGYITASLLKPAARTLDENGARLVLFYIHLFACLIGLAYLPFSKMLHVFASPISLLMNSVMNEDSDPANNATRQAIELDACVHCGTCSLRCSALAAYQQTGNCDILPSEKMQHVRAFIKGKRPGEDEMRSLQEGVYLCTNCDRCTVVCPSGINLRDLWFSVRERLIHDGFALPFVLTQLSFARALKSGSTVSEEYREPLQKARDFLSRSLLKARKRGSVELADIDKDRLRELGLSEDAGTYRDCFSCSTCTTSCPVVNNYDNPGEILGLLPHQIIHSAVLGISDMALGSGMLWDCLTCYRCQESCPQGVRVTEVLYKLKNIAAKSFSN